MNLSLQKIILTSVLLSSFFFPSLVFTETTDVLDARCFTQEQCTKARRDLNLGSTEAGKGFYNNTAETRNICGHRTDSSGKELGFCLPAGEAVTGVKFGNTNRFSNIGDFISYMYRYGVIFAGILAVLMIIIAGFQWTASGGNSSTIESAKKRIAGAITGLILVVTSYTILNTINPNMVNLRLPQVWLLREVKDRMVSDYCIQLPLQKNENGKFVSPKVGEYSKTDQDSGNFTKVKTDKDAYKIKSTISDDPLLQKYDLLYPDKEDLTACGKVYVIEGTEGSTCRGTACPNGNVCVEDKRCSKYAPTPGTIGGNIKFTDGKYMDRINLYVICGEPSGTWEHKFLQQYKLNDVSQYYEFKDVINTSKMECGDGDKVRGFFFTVEVNDTDSSATIDDVWMGGKSFCSNSNSCGFYGANSLDEESLNPTLLFGLASMHEVFTKEDIVNGFWCPFTNSEKSMPNLGDGFMKMAFDIEGQKMLQVFGMSKSEAKNRTGSLLNLRPDSESTGENFCPTLKTKKQELENALQKALQK